MNFDRLMRIDRRIIFIFTAVVIAVPLLVPMNLPMGVQKPTQRFFDTVNAIDPKEQCVLIATDYVPQTEAENQPMAIVLMRHAFAARIPGAARGDVHRGRGPGARRDESDDGGVQ